MGKREKYFEKVAEFKARFAELTNDQLERKLAVGSLVKEASVAVRELLRERAEQQQGSESASAN